MKPRTKMLFAAAAALATGALMFVAPPAQAATLTEVTNFGTNPSNLRMHLYVPDNVQARPGLLVAIHYCTGTGPVFFQNTQYRTLADQYGFIVIYPTATRSSQCFDVYSQQALTRGGGSDPVGIRSMVSYVQSRHNVDPNRIFATGTSSGAMMTNVMLALYPDVFRAGASFAGVPYTCFATTGGSEWNSQCAQGQIIRTAQQWGDAVRNAFPGYTGQRPRMQIWHGTNDETLRYPNFGEQIKQWTNAHGLSQTPTFTDTPASGQTRTRYGGSGGQAPVEAISMQGVSHNLPVNAAEVIRFFGLNTTGPSPSVSPSVSPSASPSPSPSSSPSPNPTGGPCRVAYTMNTWNSGFTASIQITNNSATPINGWTLAFTLPSGQTITGQWNATYSPTSGALTARNVSYNGTIPANGGSVRDIGFQATHNGNTGRPTSFTLNGVACSVA
ncbi:extracellular catalytic domain type 1 short-chain-length polyhydroxyalkanoate depolymerase [Allorhizocola rhizosphaerae]|uniref:extracellular catalytic domain type 1 short-chain-length polyhydroxyalkanoate depolymerase n=1 Tax=Allorhizocola rhizosphaerae TaxID=1872709 RepID=UPI000E3BBB77|nr:PHB depolymerase family esterase [Allorhizocola rhizosphaerae]